MSVANCAQCLVLLQNVTVGSKRLVTAIARHDAAVQDDDGDEEVARLKHELDFWAVERQEALDRYRFHVRSHGQIVMRAGL